MDVHEILAQVTSN